MLNINPTILKSTRLQLEPLTEKHRDELYQAAQDELIWAYSITKAVGNNFHRWFDKALKNISEKKQLAFAVRRVADQQLIGSTRYYDINADHHRVSIGYTWFTPDTWGSFINPECKYLLLKNAFESLNINRIEFMTDSRNERARAALSKLGATKEGLLRYHTILEDGYVRDTAVFSIIQADWAALKTELETRLARFSHTEPA